MFHKFLKNLYRGGDTFIPGGGDKFFKNSTILENFTQKSLQKAKTSIIIVLSIKKSEFFDIFDFMTTLVNYTGGGTHAT